MLQKIVKWSIYLLVFLLPLFWLSVSFEAFEFNKTYLLFFLTAIGLLAWLGRMIFEDKKIKFKKSPLDIFVLAFLLVTILNAVFSIDKTATVFGFYGRFWPNLVGSVSLVVLYFLITNNVEMKSKIQALSASEEKRSSSEAGKSKGKSGSAERPVRITVEGILKTFLWSSFFVLVSAYFSFFGVWPRLAKTIGLPGIMNFKSFNTISGSFGALVVFLSVVFVLLLALLAFRGVEKRGGSGEKKGKSSSGSAGYYIFLFAIFVLLILIDFWPAWLIILLSLVAFIVFAFWKRVFREDVNRLSLSILFMILSALFLFSNPLAGFLNQTKIFSNMPVELRLSQPLSWNIGFQGLKENIAFGAGAGNFSYLFVKYKPMSFVEGPFWQFRFDRASNYIAELLGTTGLLGILSYLALLGMFLMISFLVLSSQSRAGDLKEQFPLILTFLALFISQFVFYQNITMAFAFWLFLGLATISWGKPQKEKMVEFRDFPEIGLVITILFWAILIGFGFFSFVMVKYYAADVFYKDYLVKPSENLDKLERAAKLNDSQAVYHMALAREYLSRISQELAKKKPDKQRVVNLVALSIREGRRATQVAPKRIAAQETLGVVYRDIQGLAQGALQWGITTFKTALETDPNNPILMTELGKLLVVDNKTEEAKALFNKALEIRKDYTQPAVQLALIEEKAGDIKKAIARLEDLIARNPFSINGRFNLGRLYFNDNQLTKAENQFKAVLNLLPNHINAQYSLGLVYEKKGQTSKAIEEYQKALELDPGNKIIKERIAKLEQPAGEE